MNQSISRRRFLGLAAGAATAAAGLALPRCGGRGRPGNVVLIVSDAFRADRLGARRRGKSITPHLDRIGDGSLVFENGYSDSSWTKTAMASILTGAHVPYHGVRASDDSLPANCDTLADLLRRQGHRTCCIQTNPWLVPDAETRDGRRVPVESFGFRKGFDIYRFLHVGAEPGAAGQPAYPDARDVNAALELLLPRLEEPFFLYLHYMDTHQPWMGQAAREFTGAYRSVEDGRSREQIFLDDQRLVKRILADPEGSHSGAERRRLTEIYDESVRYVDAKIHEALELLRRVSDLDDALIVFTSDHGDELFEHGGVGHGHSLYDEVARVPLLIRCHGLSAARVDARVSNVSLYETIRTVVCPDDRVREPIGPSLVDPTTRAEGEVIFARLHPIATLDDWVLTKLVRTNGQESILVEDGAGMLLEGERFDLAADPGELRILPGDDLADFAAQATRLAAGWRERAASHGVEPRQTTVRWQRRFSADGPHAPALTEEERGLREQLRALGYLDGEE